MNPNRIIAGVQIKCSMLSWNLEFTDCKKRKLILSTFRERTNVQLWSASVPNHLLVCFAGYSVTYSSWIRLLTYFLVLKSNRDSYLPGTAPAFLAPSGVLVVLIVQSFSFQKLQFCSIHFQCTSFLWIPYNLFISTGKMRKNHSTSHGSGQLLIPFLKSWN